MSLVGERERSVRNTFQVGDSVLYAVDSTNQIAGETASNVVILNRDIDVARLDQ